MNLGACSSCRLFCFTLSPSQERHRSPPWPALCLFRREESIQYAGNPQEDTQSALKRQHLDNIEIFLWKPHRRPKATRPGCPKRNASGSSLSLQSFPRRRGDRAPPVRVCFSRVSISPWKLWRQSVNGWNRNSNRGSPLRGCFEQKGCSVPGSPKVFGLHVSPFRDASRAEPSPVPPCSLASVRFHRISAWRPFSIRANRGHFPLEPFGSKLCGHLWKGRNMSHGASLPAWAP